MTVKIITVVEKNGEGITVIEENGEPITALEKNREYITVYVYSGENPRTVKRLHSSTSAIRVPPITVAVRCGEARIMVFLPDLTPQREPSQRSSSFPVFDESDQFIVF
ncbi:unnamed protein product [Linum trigynum]|uniref:Uncharacterized protein n=1 Tax=Linum trigynum TaxID=586398 RepID=A0AAV2EYF6_9ROSI